MFRHRHINITKYSIVEVIGKHISFNNSRQGGMNIIIRDNVINFCGGSVSTRVGLEIKG